MSDSNYIPPTSKQLYKHKGRGHSPEISQKRNRNKPPGDEAWMWRTLAMLESPAWRTLPAGSITIVERIEIEHARHAGTENGKLPVTYDNFEAHGAQRKLIPFYIRVAETLGFIDVTEQGHAGAGDTRRAARYALTWLDRWDGAPRTNRWVRFETLADARSAVAAVRDALRPKGTRHRGGEIKLAAAA
jgi:hypothetical protein